MCGVAGVIFRQPGAIGESLLDMLRGCQHRGPDSTGLALYGPQVSQDLVLRVFLDADRCGDESSWDDRKTQLQEVLKKRDFLVRSLWSEYAQMKVAGVLTEISSHLVMPLKRYQVWKYSLLVTVWKS